MLSPNPFTPLLGPFRYACQRDFAQLDTVRNLRLPLERALADAKSQGLTAADLAPFKRELRNVDHPRPEVRQASLQRVLRCMAGLGVELPEELTAITLQSDLAPAAAAESEPEPSSEQTEPSTGHSESPTETQRPNLLSIAPTTGPLAKPLKDIGWRINPRLVATLNRKGLHRTGDVLFLLPRGYEDRRKMKTIAQLRPGERGVVVGIVKAAGEIPVRNGRRHFRAVIADSSGSIAATFFQTGPWLKARFPLGKQVVISGEVRASRTGREMPHPEVEPADDTPTSPVHFNRIVPIYPGFERHEQRSFRTLAYRIAEGYASTMEEPLPETLRKKLGLVVLADALHTIHFPRETEDLDSLNAHQSAAHRRLAFDELFFLQLGLCIRRQGVKTQPGIPFKVGTEALAKAKGVLPFQFTEAQARVVREICRDMQRPEPMNRLLQGDVGSGKTAVAMVAAAIALQDGYQVALMAPTEILAEQHAQTMRRLLNPLGFSCGLVTAGGAPKEKREVREGIARGEVRLAVGTHALITAGFRFDNLGLAIIDEQHRFGVIQRHALMSKGHRPDVLVMTATPIPRTLAMTLYGDLEVSVIDELPPGRAPIITRVFIEKQRPRVYQAMAEELGKGRQCYVVHPLVEESEKVDLSDATQGAERLRALFPDHQVGLLHGRLKQEEKDAVMRDFRDRRIQILVCTTVVEVGLDVPNATVMAIESAERFGLSQLHQLRGRVGRGAAASHCFLIAGYAKSKEASDRLSVMEQSCDGFVIAEKDLELRGPGEFLGTRQSGLPELAVANLARDGDLLSLAREEAREIIGRDPTLSRPEHRGLAKALEERWEGRLALARVG